MEDLYFSPYHEQSTIGQYQDTFEQKITYISKNIHIEEEKSKTSMRFNQLKITVEDNFIMLKPLIDQLKEEMKYTLSEGFLIYVFNDQKGEYIYIGADPLLFPVTLHINEFRNSDQIYFKFNSNQIIKKRKKRQMKNEKRLKERGIIDVRELVEEWRRTYNNLEGKVNLEHIAQSMNMSRKTLDDYSLQLRRASQLGFDFEANKHQKMGILRSFVKNHTKNRKTLPKLIILEKDKNVDDNVTYNENDMQIENPEPSTDYDSKQLNKYSDIDIFFNLNFQDTNQL